jgi:hypothetical protein
VPKKKKIRADGIDSAGQLLPTLGYLDDEMFKNFDRPITPYAGIPLRKKYEVGYAE